jgi:hypothetical protein
MQKRQSSQFVGESRTVIFARSVAASRRIQFMHQRIAAAAIDQARGVTHQVLDRDRAVGRNGFCGGFACGIARGDAHRRKFREIFGERLVDQHLATLIKHQRADSRHRLGHRGDVEDGVGGHGNAGGLVAPAIGIEHDQSAVAGDRDHCARNPACFNVGFQRFADPRQPLAGEANFLGPGPGQGVFGEGCTGSQQAK